MNPEYKILIVEDQPADAELALHEIGKVLKNFQYRIVETQNDFIYQLDIFSPNIVISDYQLPSFDGMTALKISKEKYPLLPVIIFTGSMNEDTAVECMKAGASDYVIKEHLKRLGNAVLNAFEQSDIVKEKLIAEQAFKTSEEKYRTIFENVQDVFYQTDLEGTVKEISPSIKHFSEFKREEIIGHSVSELYLDFKDREQLLLMLTTKGEIRDYEIRMKTKIGKIKYGSINARLVKDEEGKPHHIDGAIRDITERIAVSKALGQSEEKFRNLFENHSAPNMIMNPRTFEIIDANHAAAQFYGWSIEELKNLKVQEINISPLPEIKRVISTIHEEKLGNFEFQHRLKNGQIKDVEVFASEIQIADENYIHVIIHDITNKKKTEQQNRLLSKAIEQSPVVVVITNPSGIIEYVNAQFTNLTGYSFEEVIGKNPRILKSGEQSNEYYKELWDTIMAGNEWTGELQNKKKNGDLFWESATITPLVDEHGNITHFVGIKEDITEKRKILQALVSAKEKAEASDKLKSAFINNISHEVRTPLNGIVGFSELLINPEISEEKKSLFNDIIKKSSSRLLNTITSYMDISLIASGNIEVHEKTFHLNPVFDEIYAEHEEKCNDKGLSLNIIRPSIPGDLQIKSDQELLRKTFSYLLDNAIKFTQKGSIEFGFRKKQEKLEFFVTDTGVGIESDILKTIFESFMQGDFSLTRGYEGSGLGLTIANGLVKLMGGVISVNSQVGSGSTFSFTIHESSIVHPPASTPYPNEREPRILSNPIVLVAEDDEFNYKFIEIVLKKENYIVLRAENGMEAVRSCREHPGINLVLMDMKMPIMGGLEATREIKKISPNLPIIALTAYVSSSDEYQAYLSGCDEFISKPINRTRLLYLIKNYMSAE
jgi:PAS domain S-box-containing protein